MHSDLACCEAKFRLYESENGRTRVRVRFDGGSAWFRHEQMAQDTRQRSQEVV